MLILLPPSESKRAVTRGKALALNGLSHPSLNPKREQVLQALQTVCRADPAKAIEVLDLGRTQFDLVAMNAHLDTVPTAAASSVYTGVLYTQLDYASLTGQHVRPANRRIAVVSALFGLVRPTDRIPAYRLSGSARLPGIGSLPRFWRQALSEEIHTAPGLVIDMLSSPYSSMVAAPLTALTVKVWQRDSQGARTAVSHFNKATKGELARLLATTTPEPRTPQQVLDVLLANGWRAELDGSRLDVYRRT